MIKVETLEDLTNEIPSSKEIVDSIRDFFIVIIPALLVLSYKVWTPNFLKILQSINISN